MQIFISITLGLTIALLALWLIRREVMRASFFKHVKVDPKDNITLGLIEQLQKLETTVDEMNQSFYDLVSDLEGQSSIHEKELSLLDEKIEKVSRSQMDLSTLLNVQGKEIALIRPDKEEISREKETRTIQPKRLSEVSPKTEKALDSNKDEILRLIALGMDEYQIARALNKGVREIKMQMDLIKK